MSRIRTVKPEFWTSEQVVECSPTARLMFIGLWNFCDDHGVHPYSLKTIKMEIFPGDEVKISDIENWLNELIRHELLKSYHVDDKQYLIVTGWHHQKIEKPNFKYPLPENFDDHSTTVQQPIDDHSTPESSLKESKGKEIYSEDFLAFWSAYPKKSGSKKAAFENWKKLNGDKPAIEVILSAIEAQSEWRKTANGKFRPEWKDPERWIKNRMWEAELTEDEEKQSGSKW